MCVVARSGCYLFDVWRDRQGGGGPHRAEKGGRQCAMTLAGKNAAHTIIIEAGEGVR